MPISFKNKSTLIVIFICVFIFLLFIFIKRLNQIELTSVIKTKLNTSNLEVDKKLLNRFKLYNQAYQDTLTFDLKTQSNPQLNSPLFKFFEENILQFNKSNKYTPNKRFCDLENSTNIKLIDRKQTTEMNISNIYYSLQDYKNLVIFKPMKLSQSKQLSGDYLKFNDLI
ncbi:MAG: hypothetical protein HRU38_15220 [Saccharospirillaceae bacterium]|nr:hypothetical protein [Pseudomonadales bacterium]NRB79993.1 hypothetical protein [Saccharospirillaceae bacterium]